ncbi:hypothetical protein HAZT_HAZT006140 [Hyalella azteca]|uniref:BHLH domain-containing protein n=1 Tax=Hyalella azteca TaxID=294128 RepID=A0A6A0H2G7_HYAAZ|nr:hypothetical protein HAZT_HAZT006140 [Hyalella azteca]
MPRRPRNSRNRNQQRQQPENPDDMQGGKSGRREKPVQRNAANARERTRMRILARAFCRLKTTLPWVPPDTKLSKLDTLRLAASYIAHLRGVLTDPTHNTAQYDARLVIVAVRRPEHSRPCAAALQCSSCLLQQLQVTACTVGCAGAVLRCAVGADVVLCIVCCACVLLNVQVCMRAALV